MDILDNREVIVGRGETGFVLEATLKDDRGAPIDLLEGGPWTVLIKVTTRGKSTVNLLEGNTMILRDQTTLTGKAYYEFTEADALIPAGYYDLDIMAVKPLTGRKFKFPKSPGSVFGTLHMQPSKHVD